MKAIFGPSKRDEAEKGLASADIQAKIKAAGDRNAAVAARAGASKEDQETARKRGMAEAGRKYKGGAEIAQGLAGAAPPSPVAGALQAPANAFVGFAEAAKSAQQAVYDASKGMDEDNHKNISATATAAQQTAKATTAMADVIASGDTDYDNT